MSDNRPNVYYENNIMVVRASSLGSCVRSLYYAGIGLEPKPPPENMQKVFDEGNAFEGVIIQDYCQQYGAEVSDQQMEVEMPIGTGAIVRGHIDGLSVQGGEAAVYEGKFFAEDTYKKFVSDGIEAFPYYAYQVSVYNLIFELPVVFVMGIKDRLDNGAVILDRLEVEIYQEPPVSKGTIISRVMSLKKAIESTQEPNCIITYPCPYWDLHEDVKQDGVLVKDKYVEEVEKWADQRMVASKGKTTVKNIFDEAGNNLMKLAEIHGVKDGGVLLTPDLRIPIIERAGNKTISEELLKKAGINPEDYKVQGKSSYYVGKVEKREKDTT